MTLASFLRDVVDVSNTFYISGTGEVNLSTEWSGPPCWYNPVEGPSCWSEALPIEAHGGEHGRVKDIEFAPSVHQHLRQSH
jgi:hypothetical protein